MLNFTVGFLFGVSQLMWLPKINWVWSVYVFLFSLFLYLIIQQKKTFLIIFVGFNFGFSYALLTAHMAKSHQLQFIPTESINLIGEVIDLPVIKKDRVRFVFKVKSATNGIPVQKILLSWYKTKHHIMPGQLWKFNVKLKPIHGYRSPAAFDYSQWLFRKGYDATGSIKSAELISNKINNLSTQINLWRMSVAASIDDNIESIRVRALIKALTIGDKSQISFSDSQLFQQTGTAHLIAISGLHIGLMAFMGLLLARLLFLLFANQVVNRIKFEAFFSIVFALIYAALAGLSIPTIRAFLMVFVFATAYSFKQAITRWQAWSIALLVVLLLDPMSVLDVGFWFSFSAVAILMFVFSGRKVSKSKLITFIQAQWVILIGLLPLMALVFHQINFLTPLTNLLVLPLASVLLIPLIFASFFISLFSNDAANFLFYGVEQLANCLFMILDYLQHFQFLSIPIGKITPMILLAIVFAVLLLLLPRLFRWKRLGLLLLIPLFIDNNQTQLKAGEFQVNVLDVGQGLSVIVSTQNHHLIYDTGSKFETGFTLAQSVTVPYLKSRGINTIDKLVLSHADNDHAGGVEVIKSYDGGIKVYDTKGDEMACTNQLSWHWDQVDFEVLSPYELYPYLGNNSSCVIKVSNQNGSLLLTGDIEEAIEYRLYKNFPKQVESDVLMVPHHGSQSSSSKEFLKAVNPKIAINSSGFANQFHHPHPKILERYKKASIQFIDTQEKGTIELLFTDQPIKVNQYIDDNPHFWNPKQYRLN